LTVVMMGIVMLVMLMQILLQILLQILPLMMMMMTTTTRMLRIGSSMSTRRRTHRGRGADATRTEPAVHGSRRLATVMKLAIVNVNVGVAVTAIAVMMVVVRGLAAGLSFHHHDGRAPTMMRQLQRGPCRAR
jgi:hypothetical protein